MIAQNLKTVKEKIEESCKRVGRDPSSVRLMAVTKNVSPALIRKALELGITDFGENRVQEARRKVSEGVFSNARVSLIGHLQTNKASMAVRIFDEIHSIDSLKIASAVSRFSLKYRKGELIPVLLEVNIGRDPRKYGCMPEEAFDLAFKIMELPGIRLSGLMTIAPGYGDLEIARKAFRDLRVLREELISRGIPRDNLSELSMGMSSDYEVAIEEGATIVRLGTALFGPRR